MRLTPFAAAAAALTLALCACGPAGPAKEDAASAEAPARDMAAMDETMKTSDSADDAATAEAADGYTFHTAPAKVESVHLPAAAGGAWTVTASDPALLAIGEAKDMAMPGGKTHHVVKVTPKASGNASVRFERRAAAGSSAPVTETRTIQFMIH